MESDEMTFRIQELENMIEEEERRRVSFRVFKIC